MATEATENGEVGGTAVVSQGSDIVPATEATIVQVEQTDTESQLPPPSTNLVTEVAEQVVVATKTTLEASISTISTVSVSEEKKWPGWPGDSVFRLIVPVLKVGSIIGRKGELIKKMCEGTRARIRILDGVLGTTDRIVLISGKEEPEAQISPAMNAVLRVFKRINGLSEIEDESIGPSTAGGMTCSVRLLVAASQAINLIGKKGTLIKSIQEGTGAFVRVLSGDEMSSYATSDERVVDIQGDSLKVLKALEVVVGHLRKFLVDHSVIPLFEKSNATTSQDQPVEAWADKTQSLIHSASQPGYSSDYSLSIKKDSLFLDRETQLESQMQHSGVSLYGQDPVISGIRSFGLSRASAPIVTQMSQIMQIPISYAEDIIGIGGANIGYIRRTSGAILTVQESRGHPDEITVEIKGTQSQVQTAQQLIQDFIAGHKDPVGSYGKMDTGVRSYSQLGNTSYSSSSLEAQGFGGYGSSGLGGYSSFRL